VLKSLNNFEPRYLGLVEFEKALALQNQLHADAKEFHKQFILGLEHPQVMTLGLRAHALDLKSLCHIEWKFPVHKISRGGLATIHNPGQLVIYPIIDLKKSGLSVKSFVQILFKATENTLAELGIKSTADICDQPGVYTEKGKIAFCGLQIKNGITLHGLSINIHNDTTVFKQIQSCGISEPQIDSVSAHGVTLSTQDFFMRWLKHFNLDFIAPECL
jgi:lipoyl(octanoyl) transferase